MTRPPDFARMQIGTAFTVWSDGQLVGESALDYVANTSEVKFGDFVATEFGERVIAIRMAPRKAVCARAPLDEIEALYAFRQVVPMELRAPNGSVVPTDDIEITDLEWLVTLLPPGGHRSDDWQADLELAEFELEEELFQEKETNPLIPPELLESGIEACELEEIEFCGETDAGDGPDQEFPRYQIQVHIKGGG